MALSSAPVNNSIAAALAAVMTVYGSRGVLTEVAARRRRRLGAAAGVAPVVLGSDAGVNGVRPRRTTIGAGA